MDKEYFILKNEQTEEKLICSWWQNEPLFYGQKVYYIGLTDGLGGLKNMEEKGFVFKPITARMKRMLEKMVPSIIFNIE